MLSAIFTNEISDLEVQLQQLQSQIAEAKNRKAHLSKTKRIAEGAIATLQTAYEKISAFSPEAIASLKAAVLNLFQDEKTPIDECSTQTTTTNTKPELNGQYCEINPDAYWITATPDGSAWELATEFACQLTDAPIVHENHYAELVKLTDEIAYIKKYDGEILAAYVGFTNKVKARLWGEHLAVHNTFASGFEIRSPKRLNSVKHELKLWGMSAESIQRLAECDLSKTPITSEGDTFKRQPLSAPKTVQPIRIEDIAVGDRVRSKTMKDWQYRVLGITESGHLDCERIGVTPTLRLAMHPSSVELVATVKEQNALDSIHPPALTYKPYGRGLKAATHNWEVYQAHKRQKQIAIAATESPDIDF